MRQDTGFMGTTRRLRRVVDRRISMAGWWPWFANVPLLVAVLTGLILLTSALVERLPGQLLQLLGHVGRGGLVARQATAMGHAGPVPVTVNFRCTVR